MGPILGPGRGVVRAGAGRSVVTGAGREKNAGLRGTCGPGGGGGGAGLGGSVGAGRWTGRRAGSRAGVLVGIRRGAAVVIDFTGGS